MNRTDNIRTIKGVGEKSASLFCKLGIITIEDLLFYYPRTYVTFEAPVPILEADLGVRVAIQGRIQGEIKQSNKGRLPTTSLRFVDGSASVHVTWFRMPYLKQTLPRSQPFILYGKINKKGSFLSMDHPDVYYPIEKYHRMLEGLQPIYALTSGLSNTMIHKVVSEVLRSSLELIPDYLPIEVRDNYQLEALSQAIQSMHQPEDRDSYIRARRRLVFDEFLLFTLSIEQLKAGRIKPLTSLSIVYKPEIEPFLHSLPYQLTQAQYDTFQEIVHDMTSDYIMERLVQGDVGSGKTIIAILSMYMVVLNGYQAVLMAPTEVLARQHYQSITQMLGEHCKIELLTGSLTSKSKQDIYTRIESGESQMIIGTHAVFQDKVHYHSLGLVVTDEQHRFGVKQRETLANKGHTPHILVMSATPIPRTLAVILYGDLDLSIMREMPKSRLPIKNCVVETSYRPTAYRFMQQQVREGRQCYVICPTVEEGENNNLANVIDYAAELQKIIGSDIRVTYLHGRMKQHEKDHIMETFASNEIQILVSTTVIEVGIDVPNATVILIENSERFGLAQLHQLRGRVGRGSSQSYCIFMTSTKNKDTRKRLEILNQSTDGFFIAEEDMRLRGTGDIFGIRQSGYMEFTLGDIFQDVQILKEASTLAKELISKDINLEQLEHQQLKRRFDTYQHQCYERLIL